MKYVMAFDIVDDHRRYRVSKVLLEYGYRVQRSVFEGFLSKESFDECKKKLLKIIDTDNDSVRFYQMCSGCAGQLEELGSGPVVEQMRYMVI